MVAIHQRAGFAMLELSSSENLGMRDRRASCRLAAAFAAAKLRSRRSSSPHAA